MSVIFNDYIQNKNLVHYDNITEYIGALRLLVETSADRVMYKTHKKFLLNNIPALQIDSNGNYYYQTEYNPAEDYIDSFKLHSCDENNRLSFIINGKEYFNITEYLTICSPYMPLQFKITFHKKPSMDDTFMIAYNSYLLDSSIRHFLMKNKIITDSFTYYSGCLI